MQNDAFAALRHAPIRRWMAAGTTSGLASSALNMAVGYQVYDITGNLASIGVLGAVEAVPSVGLALFGGHFADKADRRKIVLFCQFVAVLCAIAFATLSALDRRPALVALYSVVFVAGIAKGFRNPAANAFEARVIPKPLYVNASAWSSSLGQISAVVGPAAAGVGLAVGGASGTYAVIAVLSLVALGATMTIRPRESEPDLPAGPKESIWTSIFEGLQFVWRSKPLLGSMALDLFAVLFGGAIALLPAFAKDVLHVGPRGLGLLQASPAAGALLVMLYTTKRPPIARAGRNLLVTVALFGGTMILFAVSRNLWLTAFALFLSGVFDGVSMVIRGAILRLLTPDRLRGRVSAVSWVFIGSSNEFGALESGFAAKWFGLTRSVFWGGVVTLGVVTTVATTIPELVRLRLGNKD